MYLTLPVKLLQMFIFLLRFRDPKEIVRPRIPLSACIQSFAATETVDDFYSSAIKGKTIAKK